MESNPDVNYLYVIELLWLSQSNVYNFTQKIKNANVKAVSKLMNDSFIKRNVETDKNEIIEFKLCVFKVEEYYFRVSIKMLKSIEYEDYIEIIIDKNKG